MGKVNSHNTQYSHGKSMGKNKHSKVMSLSNILGGFPWYGKNMGKHKYFKFMDFLNISDEAEIHTLPKIWEK